jgi:hypothetical protein
MSIFKETFNKHIIKQFGIRETIIKQGNNPNNSNRFGNPQIEVNQGLVVPPKTVKLAAGAFYTNTVHRQCVIRMMSGVDIMSKSLLETAEKNIPNNLAKMFILEGGTLPYRGTPKKGFGSEGAYNDPATRSNAGDGYGIVPMPGIINAEIRTKTTYGSLREAKVNFVCHNKRQLSALEILYMRPGMPLLLEWQWSPFIDNDGLINTTNYSLEGKWFNRFNNLTDFNQEIIAKKTSSGGNYDGFVGFCKNFNIVSRPDGGYDCTTEIIASGEVLQGLKARREGHTKLLDVYVNSEGEEIAFDADEVASHLNEVELDNMELILEGILELSNINSFSAYVGGQAAVVTTLDSGSISGSTTIATTLSPLSGMPITETVTPQVTEGSISTTLLTALNTDLASFLGSYKDYDFLWKGEATGEETPHSYKANFFNTYMSWRTLCDLVNKLVFPNTDSSQPNEPLLKLVVGRMENLKFEYLKMIPYKFTENVSYTYGGVERDLNALLDNSFDPSVCILPKQNRGTPAGTEFYIGNILLDVEHMLTKYREMAYKGNDRKENFNLFDFFAEIWKDVNTACVGHHNFILQTDMENPNWVRVIDLSSNCTLKPADLFEFKIQGNESIVRDFNYNSTIPSSLSATIAIAAQAPHNASTLDQATFANFSRGIKSRFYKESALTSNGGITTTLKEQYEKDVKKLIASVGKLEHYMALIFNSEKGGALLANRKENEVDGDTYGEVMSTAKTVENLMYSLLSRDSTTGEKTPIIPLSRSAVVPLKFNCQLDGIGGLVVGNVFKVEKEKLPMGYRGEDVAFVLFGESQQITAGQDWTTEISGNIILLDMGDAWRKQQEDAYYLETTGKVRTVGRGIIKFELTDTTTGIGGGVTGNGVTGNGVTGVTITSDNTQPGVVGGAVGADPLYIKLGATLAQWDIYRNSIAKIESGGKYDISGGANNHYDGRYQLGKDAKTDGAKKAGVPDPGHGSAARKSFRESPSFQEKIFTGFTIMNHNYLTNNSTTYATASVERKLQILGYAHNQGMGGALKWITTGIVGADGFGTKGTKYTDLIAANFKVQ